MPGEQMAIRIHSSQVGGAITVIEARVPALIGPPKHIHKEREEVFEILEGTFRFQVGDEEFEATREQVSWFPEVYLTRGQMSGLKGDVSYSHSRQAE